MAHLVHMFTILSAIATLCAIVGSAQTPTCIEGPGKQVDADNASEACSAEEKEETFDTKFKSLVQVGARESPGASFAEERETDGAKFTALEQWQELMHYELFPAEDLAKGELTVSKQEWAQAFEKLDADGDGQLNAHDIAEVYNKTASHHINTTQEHYRLAVAKMADLFPEYGEFFVVHQPALIFLAETNKSAPLDAPLPDKESVALFKKKSRELALLQWRVSPCLKKLSSFAIKAVTWGFTFLDIWIAKFFANHDPPPMAWVTRTKGVVMEKVFDSINECWELVQRGWAWEAANHFWKFLTTMFSVGAVEEILREAANNMSWWDWAQTGVLMLASFLAQLSSAGAYLIARAVHQIIHAVDLTRLALDTVKTCH